MNKREYNKLYYADNKEKLKEYAKSYYQTNKEKLLEQMRDYRKEHKEEIKSQRLSNSEKRSEVHSKWREKNKEKLREYNRNRDKQRWAKYKMEREMNPNLPSAWSQRDRTIMVYAFFDESGICLYVGRGPIERIKAHRYRSKLWYNDKLLRITMTCKDEWEAMEYEGRWGGLYHPIMNKDGYRY